MPAYICVEVEIHDPAKYEHYKGLAPGSIARYGGRYLTRGGAIETLEGDWHPRRLVLLEFPSMERAREWYDSPEYAEGKAMRHASATSRMLLLEGLPEGWTP